MTDRKRPAGRAETSLLGQFGQTRASLMALLHAHIDLFKAELDSIMGEIKILATQAGIALVVALMTGILMWVGGFLFAGEWLFGSIGWGLAHGVLFGVALIVALALAIVGARPRYAVTSFVISLVVVILVAVVCGSNVAYNQATLIAPNLASPFGSPGVVALVGGLIIGALLFAFLLAFVGGLRGAIGGLFIGIVPGAIAGWLIGGAPWTLPPAVGFAITIGLIAWPILNVIICFPRLNVAERFKRLYPRQSIEAANETRAWLEEQWQTRLPKRGSK